MRREAKLGSGIGVICFSLSVLWGCSTASSATKEATPVQATLLEPQAIVRFSDIPVPMGFKLLPKDSYTFESAGVRVGMLRYRGKGNPDHMVNFYKEQMSLFNWDMLNIIEFGDRMLNFQKDDESCIVHLLPKGNTVTISISFGPTSQRATLTKRAREPLK